MDRHKLAGKPLNLPKTQRGLSTLNKIIKAAEKEFGKNGYHGSGMVDIAAAAGVAPGTIYIYFGVP